nr:FMN-binding negative transcriptional regulator [Alkalihalobacterium alkalinitrilicum]
MLSIQHLLYDIIKKYSFATFFSTQRNAIYNSFTLTLNKENTYLYGHFAKANPQWNDITDQTVLAVFHSPLLYISILV